jgi:Kef-type K+ transport system membrane component KefB
MHLLYVLLVLLLATRICSEFATRLKQPALVGELMGGVLVGVFAATFLDGSSLLTRLADDDTFNGVLDLAVFFLMLLAGVRMRPKDLAEASPVAIPIAIVGMFVPLFSGFALGWIWFPESDWKLAQCLFLGVALAITAVPVAVKVLMDLDQLQTRVGRVVIAAAVMDDVLSLILLAVLTSLISADESLSPASVLLLIMSGAGFFAIAWAAGRFLLPQLGKLIRRLNLEHADFTALVVFGLALSVLAEWLGMPFLIGAFAAGVFFTRGAVGKQLHDRVTLQIEALTLGFLAPVFFASIGIQLDLSAVTNIPVFLVVLLSVATAGKLVGAGFVARLRGFDRNESIAVGAAMNARGAVEIIIADIAARAGLFQYPQPVPPVLQYLFSAIVIMAVVTTVASPMLLRWSLGKAKRE